MFNNLKEFSRCTAQALTLGHCGGANEKAAEA
jgi:hypothetical protein